MSPAGCAAVFPSAARPAYGRAVAGATARHREAVMTKRLPRGPAEAVVPLQVIMTPDDLAGLAWQDEALCAQVDYALETGQAFGIWGGMSERERRVLRRRAA